MKRSICYGLAVLIGWGSVTQPARAFLPPLIFAGYMTSTVSGGTYTLAGLAGVIGLAGMYLTVKDAQDNAIRVPLGDKPENQPPAPSAPAVAPATTTGGLPDNASTVRALWCTTDYPGGCGTASTLQQCISNYQGGFAGRYCQVYEEGDPNNGKKFGANCSGCTAATPVAACPSGYTDVSGTCTLSNPRQVSDDKTCDLLYAQGGFATAADMNCGSQVDGSKLAPMIRDGKMIAYGTNSTGQPLMWEVTPGAQVVTVKEIQQVDTATQSQVKTITATIDATTGEVISVQTQTAPGSIASPASATAPTVTTEPTTSTNTPTVNQDPTKPLDVTTCGLPGSPACAIDDTQFSNKDGFSAPKSSEISTELDSTKTQLENVKDVLPSVGFDWLPSLLPGSAAQCAALPVNISISHGPLAGLSVNDSLDICDKLQLVREILGYLLGVATIFYVWRTFARSNEGA